MEKGKIEVVYGPMFAGKTSYLIKRIGEWKAEKQQVFVVKPKIDDRYGTDSKLYSHNGTSSNADLMVELEEIDRVIDQIKEKRINWLVIDEAMFFPAKIVSTVTKVKELGVNVLLAGLDLDYRGENFGSMQQLRHMAQIEIPLTARCSVCGEAATMTKRFIGGKQQIVGATDIYQPVCAHHHTIPEEFAYPYLRERRTRKGLIRIEVMADSMRVGKTTAVQVLAQGMRDLGYEVTESYEDWQHNPYLKGSYKDPEKNFLNSQKWFVRRKWEQVKEGAKKGIFIQDVAPEMDYCYAVTNKKLGRMSEKNFSLYDKYFRVLDWKKSPAPDILVYLQASDEELLARAEKSRREFETVDSEYFLTMKKVNREWLNGANNNYKIIVIDTDRIDFANEESGREALIHKVIDCISK